MQAWWAAPIGRAVGYGGEAGTIAGGRFSSLVFASHGITPIGYAAFAFTLGVTAGALIRRTVPAMAVTLAIFAAVQIATPLPRPRPGPGRVLLRAAQPPPVLTLGAVHTASGITRLAHDISSIWPT